MPKAGEQNSVSNKRHLLISSHKANENVRLKELIYSHYIILSQIIILIQIYYSINYRKIKLFSIFVKN